MVDRSPVVSGSFDLSALRTDVAEDPRGRRIMSGVRVSGNGKLIEGHGPQHKAPASGLRGPGC